MEKDIDNLRGTKVEISLLKAFNVRLEGFSPEQVTIILGKIFNIKVFLISIILLIILVLIKFIDINNFGL